jgi:glycerol-3-phosphate acyltransferase PlsY
MSLLFDAFAVILGYLLGSIPFGFLIVKISTGKDLRTVESGRTGGTNAARAAGFWAGLLTAILDILKGAAAVWIARYFTANGYTDHAFIHVLAPIAAILGHNYSFYMMERDERGRLKFRGGAGGAPALGGAMGLWLPMFPIAFLTGAVIWFTLGIASVTTMAIGVIVIVMFAIRAALNLQPSIDIWYGIIAELLLIWALRPNIQKLISGNERVIKYSLNGWLRARREAKGGAKN